MKKIRLLTALCSFLWLAACSNNDPMGGSEENPVAVEFGTGNIAASKTISAGGETLWTQGDRIGIFMLKNEQSLTAANIAENADNRHYRAQAGGSNQSGFTPAAASETVYYPQDGSRVDFIAYYPHTKPLTGYVLPIDVSNQTNLADIDVLYSNNAKGYNKNDGTVDLQFHHVLSNLSITLQAGTGAPDLTGAKVQITDLSTTASIDLASGAIRASNDRQTLTLNTTADGSGSSAIVVPQSLSDTKLILTLADDVNEFEWTFTTATFEAGMKYSYILTVNKTSITLSTSNITDWTGTADNPTEGIGSVFYEVGDYYPNPTNVATAIGVVFWVDPSDNRHGKAVSLTQRLERWGVEKDEQAEGVTGIRSTTDGRTGTRNLIAKRKDERDFATNYGIFNWIYQTLNDGDIDGVWYLPALEELNVLYSAFIDYGRTEFNNKITSAGGTDFLSSWYLSSSEYSYHRIYMVSFGLGSFNYGDKSDIYRARGILAF